MSWAILSPSNLPCSSLPHSPARARLGIAGFAFGLFASAIWLHVVTPAQSAALIAAFAIVIQGLSLWKLRHALKLSRLSPYLIGAALGIPLGAAVCRAGHLPLCGVHRRCPCSLQHLQPGAAEASDHRRRQVCDGVIGAISGFVGGSTGLAGIPVVVWSTLRGWSKDEQRAVFRTGGHHHLRHGAAVVHRKGMVTAATVWLFVLGLPAVLFGHVARSQTLRKAQRSDISHHCADPIADFRLSHCSLRIPDLAAPR